MPQLQTRDYVVIGAGVALVGTALYLAYRKPGGVYVGETLTIDTMNFNYRGPAIDTLYVCWGLKGDDFVLNNKWGWGGPFGVDRSIEYVNYAFVPEDDFDNQADLLLSEDFVEPDEKYTTRVWITRDYTSTTDYILEVDGPKIEVLE